MGDNDWFDALLFLVARCLDDRLAVCLAGWMGVWVDGGCWWLSVYLAVCLSVWMSVAVWLTGWLSVYMYVYLAAVWLAGLVVLN